MSPSSSVAQTGTVVGTATDSKSGDPIPNANIRFVDGTPGTMTGADGVYRLNGVPAGRPFLVANALGYAETGSEVDLPAGATVKHDWQLFRWAPSEPPAS